jgi:uncharacterized DUF497 family protein
MRIGFDPHKSAKNARERGLPFELVADLGWDKAIIIEDTRRQYGERRMRAFLHGGGKPYVVVYTIRGPVRWIISFRRARETERRPMSRKPDPYVLDDDNPEWTAEDFARARPIQETDPGMLEAVAAFRRRGRPPVERPKKRMGFRLAADVVDGIRATGRGYNARVEKVLREALAQGKL